MKIIENILLIAIILLAAFWDAKTKRIPNKIIMTGIICGLLATFFSNGIRGVLDNSLGLMVGIIILLIPFAMGGIGAGDVKLLGVIGAIKGVKFVIYTFLSTAVWGGLAAMVLLAYHKQLLNILKWIGSSLYQFILFLFSKGRHKVSIYPIPTTKLSIPYAVPMFLGTVTILIMGVV